MKPRKPPAKPTAREQLARDVERAIMRLPETGKFLTDFGLYHAAQAARRVILRGKRKGARKGR